MLSKNVLVGLGKVFHHVFGRQGVVVGHPKKVVGFSGAFQGDVGWPSRKIYHGTVKS